MKILRILGIVLGAILLLIVIGVGVLFVSFDSEKIKGELVSVVMSQTQRKLEIQGNLGLSVWPDVGLKLGRTTLSEPGGKTEFLALDSARVAVAVMPLLSRQVQVKRVELEGLSATLIKRKDGTLSIADLTGGAADKDADKSAKEKDDKASGNAPPLNIDIEGVRIANAQLTWRDEASGSTTVLSNLDFSSGPIAADGARKTVAIEALVLTAKGKSDTDAFELKLDVPQLSLSPEKTAGDTINLGAKLDGKDRTLTAGLALTGVEGNLKSVRINRLAIDLDAKVGESILKAHLDSPVKSDLEAQTLMLDKLAGSIDLANPKMPMKQLKLPLSGSLSADLVKKSAALALGTRFDESTIALKLMVSRFAPLALGFDLNIDTLNVDKYLPPKTAEAKDAADKSAASDKGKVDDKLDFSALKGPDVNGSLHIGSLQVAKLKLADLNARIRLASGRLDVSPLTLKLYEGSARGVLSLNAAGNQLALKQDLAGISINPLMKDLADKDLLEGRGNVSLNVASHGDTVSAMKKALGGTASLSLRDGAIKGINLAQSLRDIKGKLGAKQDSTQQAKSGEKTDFSELSASMTIKDGVAHNEDLAMKSPFLRLAGAGDIDIGRGQMNYLAKASVVASSAGQGGEGLDQLKGLTIPVRVTGPFEALSYKLELGDLVADMAKAKLDEKKDEIKAKAEDKLKSKLKGLFSK